MTDKEQNIAGLAQFSYIAYEYWQASKDELIRLGELHNSTKYRERFTANRRIKKELTDNMEDENKHLRKSLELYGKHLRSLVDRMDGMTTTDKFQETNEVLYSAFEKQIKKV